MGRVAAVTVLVNVEEIHGSQSKCPIVSVLGKWPELPLLQCVK